MPADARLRAVPRLPLAPPLHVARLRETHSLVSHFPKSRTAPSELVLATSAGRARRVDMVVEASERSLEDEV